VQLPNEQVWDAAHTLPHVPQLLALAEVSTQLPALAQ
jgi:hypothetical protein